jgi:hypothetical protein
LGRIKNTTLPEGNKWIDNGTSIQLAKKTSGANAVYDFTLKCNQFKLSCADGPNATATSCDGEPLRKGLVIGEGVRVKSPDGTGTHEDEIGGVGMFSTANQYPNANDWPVAYPYTGPVRGLFPTGVTNIQVGWSSPANWRSLQNDQANPLITYNRYRNEFVRSSVEEVGTIRTLPTPTNVKTDGTPGNPLGYEPTCASLISDPDPIFPARIAVMPDSQSITSANQEFEKIRSWLGEAVPNPAQVSTLVRAYIPAAEEMAILQFVELGTGKVLSSKALVERGNLEIAIDLNHFQSGTYGYQIILKNKKLGARRFVVVK